MTILANPMTSADLHSLLHFLHWTPKDIEGEIGVPAGNVAAWLDGSFPIDPEVGEQIKALADAVSKSAQEKVAALIGGLAQEQQVLNIAHFRDEDQYQRFFTKQEIGISFRLYRAVIYNLETILRTQNYDFTSNYIDLDDAAVSRPSMEYSDTPTMGITFH